VVVSSLVVAEVSSSIVLVVPVPVAPAVPSSSASAPSVDARLVPPGEVDASAPVLPEPSPSAAPASPSSLHPPISAAASW
jgi:hypothetical protein